MNDAPAELNREMRERSKEIAERVAQEARFNLATRGPQGAAVMDSVRARKDRIPMIVAAGGGKAKVNPWMGNYKRKMPTNADIWYGANFGADTLRQFPKKRMPDYSLYLAVKQNRTWIAGAYFLMLERIFEKYDTGS